MDIDDSAVKSDTESLLINDEDIITIEDEVESGTIIDEITEEDDITLDILDSGENELKSESLDFESAIEEEDEITVFEDLDSGDSVEHELLNQEIEIETIEDDISIEEDIILEDLNTGEITGENIDIDITEEEIVLNDLDTDELSQNINFDLDEIEEIDEEIQPVAASEPEATSVIDMELPEMQDEGLSELSPQLKTEI